MCQFLLNLFKPKTTVVSLSLPHPEESRNDKQTVVNINVGDIVLTWQMSWNVPIENREFLDKSIVIQPLDTWPPELLTRFPKLAGGAVACTVSDPIKHLYILAPYLNPGTIAYEMAHPAFALLTDEQKTKYQVTFSNLRGVDPLLVKLFKQYSGELTADTDVDIRIAGHAQIYRILGDQMPEILKQYYPQLL